MESPPPFGAEGVARGVSGLPAPLGQDGDAALRRAMDADDLALMGLAPGEAAVAPGAPAPTGWRARVRRVLRLG